MNQTTPDCVYWGEILPTLTQYVSEINTSMLIHKAYCTTLSLHVFFIHIATRAWVNIYWSL